MKGSYEVHWKEPGKLVRDRRVDRKEVFLETQLDKAKELYRALRSTRFTFNVRLMKVERYTSEGDESRKE